MQALGLIEGHHDVLEERYADGDEARLPRLAADLIASGVSIIVARPKRFALPQPGA